MAGRDGQATRDALLAGAIAAIADEGWQAAGSRSVARRAGVPLGALNYHFAGKEELFRTAAMTEVGRMFAAPGRIMRDSATLPEFVERMLGWSRSKAVTHRQQVLLLEVIAQSRRDPQLSAVLGESLAGYRAAVAAALARLAGDGTDAGGWDARASAFAAHCDGLWLHAVMEPGFPDEPAGEQSAAAWLALLRA